MQHRIIAMQQVHVTATLIFLYEGRRYRFEEIVMPSVALQFPSGRGSRGSGLSRFARSVVRLPDLVVSAIVEARQIATTCHELSRMSDAELRKRGLTRGTIVRFAVLGRV
jgi:hypothetical protein